MKNQISTPILFALIIIFMAIPGYSFEDGIRIAWDYSTAQHVTYGVYARVHPINDGQFGLVYSDGPDVWFRRSTDHCETWSNQILVDHEDGYNNTNAELVRLANGWLLYAWNGRPMQEGGLPYIIKTKISKDNGVSWGDERLIYSADNTFENGCWEPVMMQIPSGEIQLFFANENPYRNNFDQEITMFRSFDNGLTWGDYTTTSYRGGHRDGMPVPVRLQNGKGMVYCIEDNGFNGNFKPVIIYSSNENNWTQGPVVWNSPNRWGALRNDYALGSGVYAGAPYLIQLPSGETVMSIQSSEGRISGNEAMTQVYIGNDEAKDFSRKSTPLPWLPSSGNALWNALEVIDDNTVILTSSVNTAGAGPGGIWTIKGKVIRPMKAPMASITIDGLAAEFEWETAGEVFLGSQSLSSMTTKTAYDNKYLYVFCDVKDQHLWAESPEVAWDDDGVEIYIDPQNKNCNGVCEGMYKLLFNIGGGTLFDRGNAALTWEPWSPQGLQVQFKTNGSINDNSSDDVGYSVEIAIPWSQIGGRPQVGSGWGIHFKLHDDDNGEGAEFHEDLSGNDPNKASTYLKTSLDFSGDGTGLTGSYFQGQNFDNFQFNRLDKQVYFNWGNGSPDPVMSDDDFSVKWTGYIQVPASGEYTFYINSDNGRRLRINNQLVIDKWVNDWDVEYSGKIYLEKDIKYPIELDYFEAFGGANISFEWSSSMIEKSLVPSMLLYPADVITSDLDIREVKLNAYPNPFSEYIILDSPSDAKVLMYNVYGQVVLRGLTSGKNDVKGLSSGIYFLKVKVNKGEKVMKIRKED